MAVLRAIEIKLKCATVMPVSDTKRFRLTNATGKHVAFLESLLESFHADAFLIHYVLCWTAREKSGKLVVKCNKVLGDTPTL